MRTQQTTHPLAQRNCKSPMARVLATGGEVLLAEDTRGRGHSTRSLDGVGRWSVFIGLPDGSLFGWLWARPTNRELLLMVLVVVLAVALSLERARGRATQSA